MIFIDEIDKSILNDTLKKLNEESNKFIYILNNLKKQYNEETFTETIVKEAISKMNKEENIIEKEPFKVKRHLKKKQSFVLDDNDKKVIELFGKLGMPKNLARTLIYITKEDECLCKKIKSPNGDEAMQELKRRGWVKTIKLQKSGRVLYALEPTTSLHQILEVFEQEKEQEVLTIKKDLKELHIVIDKLKY